MFFCCLHALEFVLHFSCFFCTFFVLFWYLLCGSCSRRPLRVKFPLFSRYFSRIFRKSRFHNFPTLFLHFWFSTGSVGFRRLRSLRKPTDPVENQKCRKSVGKLWNRDFRKMREKYREKSGNFTRRGRREHEPHNKYQKSTKNVQKKQEKCKTNSKACKQQKNMHTNYDMKVPTRIIFSGAAQLAEFM